MQLTEQDLIDYDSIKQFVPDAQPKEVKKLKELMQLAREIPGCPPENILQLFTEIPNPDIRENLRRGIKGCLTKAKSDRTKPTPYEESGQLSLFHPEAFQGGDNQTLREIPREFN